MTCPHCASPRTKEQRKIIALGYRTFCYSDCRRTFNERTGTLFNFLEYPTDIVLLVVLWRLRYKLSLRDLAEMFLQRGLCSHMKPFETGKRALPHSWPTTCELSGGDKLENPGTSTKRTSA